MAFQFFESVIGLNVAGNYAALVQHWGVDVLAGETPFEVAKDFVNNALPVDPGPGSFLAMIAGLMGDDCFISSARCRKVDGAGGATYPTVFTSSVWPGTFGGDVDGAQVAGFMLGFTDGGAGLFAKNWIPGVSEDALLSGRFTSVYVTAANLYLESWLNGLAGDTGTFYPYLKHGSPVASYNRIVFGQLGATPGTIRRRLVPI